MTAEEVGQYMLLLLAQWQSKDEQAFPEERVEHLIRGRLSANVRKKFSRVEVRGVRCLRNDRLASEWARASEIHAKMSAGGQSTAAQRWGADNPPTHPPMPQPTTHNGQETPDNPEPSRALARAKKKNPSWVGQACDDWNERFGESTAPGGRIGKGLKLIVSRYGWEVIRPGWRRYLREKDEEFATPQDFASKLRMWLTKRGVDKNLEASKRALEQWFKGKKDG